MSTPAIPSPGSPAAPVLKWAGGKRRLLSQYARRFPKRFGSYFEPFFGGGAVYFWLYSAQRLEGRKVVLNDINPDLINFYRVLKDDCAALTVKLAEHQNKHEESYFYALRQMKPEQMDAVEKAARLLYLNRTCFNGLYRVNSKGEFNVPLGRYKNPTICDPPRLSAASRALAGVTLLEGSYKEATSTATEGDLVYFDPPYVPLNITSNFTSYTRENFGPSDQEDLAQTFRELAERGVKVLLSNSDTPRVRELFKDFKKHKILAPRAINSKADRRQKVSELLIST